MEGLRCYSEALVRRGVNIRRRIREIYGPKYEHGLCNVSYMERTPPEQQVPITDARWLLRSRGA